MMLKKNIIQYINTCKKYINCKAIGKKGSDDVGSF